MLSIAISNAVIVFVLYLYLSSIQHNWMINMSKKATLRLVDDLALEMGVKSDQVFDQQNQDKLQRILHEKFTEKNFNNRLANLFQLPNLIILNGSFVVEFILFFWAGWRSFEDPALNWWFFWLVIVTLLIFWIIFIINWSLSIFLTGHPPGLPATACKDLRKRL